MLVSCPLTDSDSDSVTEHDIYIFHDSVDSLARIDLTTGNLTYIGTSIDYGVNTRGAVISAATNEYVGFDSGVAPQLVRINLDTGVAVAVAIPASFLTAGSDFDDRTIGPSR